MKTDALYHPLTHAEALHVATLDFGVRVVVATLAGPVPGYVTEGAWRGRVRVRLDGSHRAIAYRVSDVQLSK